MRVHFRERTASGQRCRRDTHDQPIRILHLSDIHFRASKAWDADPVLRALARFVKTEVEAGMAPDLVVFSGDLAFSGKAAEYKLARTWLEGQLWPALPGDLPRDRLLLVPGNHDVDRSKVGTGVRSMQDGLLNATHSGRHRRIARARRMSADMMLRRHAAYMDFVADWYGEPQPLPWWQRVIEIRSTRTAHRRSGLRLDVLRR